jgi:hypothetical protein
MLVAHMVRQYKKESFIVLSIAAVICISAVAMAYQVRCCCCCVCVCVCVCVAVGVCGGGGEMQGIWWLPWECV